MTCLHSFWTSWLLLLSVWVKLIAIFCNYAFLLLMILNFPDKDSWLICPLAPYISLCSVFDFVYVEVSTFLNITFKTSCVSIVCRFWVFVHFLYVINLIISYSAYVGTWTSRWKKITLYCSHKRGATMYLLT